MYSFNSFSPRSSSRKVTGRRPGYLMLSGLILLAAGRPWAQETPRAPRGERLIGRVQGHFLPRVMESQYVVWTRSSEGGHRLRLYQRTGTNYRVIAHGAPNDLRRMAVGDVDSDGRDELVVELFQPSKLEAQAQRRIHIYDANTRRGFVPRWRGSHLSRPFLDWTLLPRASGKGCDLLAREVNRSPEWRGYEWLAVYRWNGFGFRVFWETSVRGRIAGLRARRDAIGPVVNFHLIAPTLDRNVELRPVTDSENNWKLRARILTSSHQSKALYSPKSTRMAVGSVQS